MITTVINAMEKNKAGIDATAGGEVGVISLPISHVVIRI